VNIFNRVLAILFGLLIVAGATYLLLVVGGWVSPEQFSQWSPNIVAFFQKSDTLVRIGSAVGCVFFALVGLLLLFLELRPDPHGSKRLLLKQDALGSVTVAVSGVEELVSREAGRIEGVMEVTSRIKEAKDGLHILGLISVAPEASVPDLAQEFQERIKAAVQRYVGRAVTEVRVDAQLAPLNRGLGRTGRVR